MNYYSCLSDGSGNGIGDIPYIGESDAAPCVSFFLLLGGSFGLRPNGCYPRGFCVARDAEDFLEVFNFLKF